MSRIPPSALKKPAVESAFQLESGLFSTTADDHSYALFGPLHYEPGYAYPLIIWLHGPANDEHQLRRVMPLVSMRNYVAVAPRGLCQIGKDGPFGFGWPQTDEACEQAEHHIFDALEVAAEKFHISRRKVFLAGFDQGGTMAFRVALSHPQHFAGVLSLGGRFPVGPNSFREPHFRPKDSRSSSPPDAIAPNIKPMKSAKIFDSCTRPACRSPCGNIPAATSLRPQMLADVDRWIIEQITEASQAAQPAENEWSFEKE